MNSLHDLEISLQGLKGLTITKNDENFLGIRYQGAEYVIEYNATKDKPFGLSKISSKKAYGEGHDETYKTAPEVLRAFSAMVSAARP
ncbi:MAG TPA: hypothetical protein VFA52_03700 [Candidatus Paceibacterota bacterium]|nr:hypothetical protein [Candidatus Paceibacterota bacterium]